MRSNTLNSCFAIFRFVGFMLCAFTMLFQYLRSVEIKQSNADDPVWVSYCDLMKYPEKYNERVVAVEGIVVMQTTPILDGDPEFLYSTRCNNPESFIVTEFSGIKPDASSEAAIAYKAILDKGMKRKQPARARLIIVGRFFYARQGQGFGHLGYFRAKLSVLKTESVYSVDGGVQWPLNYKLEK